MPRLAQSAAPRRRILCPQGQQHMHRRIARISRVSNQHASVKRRSRWQVMLDQDNGLGAERIQSRF